MERRDIEAIVQSVITQYGVTAEITRIASFGGEWKLEIRSPSAKHAIRLLPNSSPQHVRQKVMSALGIEG